MRLLFCCSCLLVLGSCTGNLLHRTMDALENALQYLHRKVDQINLDAVFCLRQTQEQLQSFLDYEPEVFEGVRPRLEQLRDLAKQTADEAIPYVKAQDPLYFESVGLYTKEKKIEWYPSQETSEDYVVEAVNCSVYVYDWVTENNCYHTMAGGDGKVCDVSPSCIAFNEQYQQRLYGITHQVIFWQQMQGFGCIERVPVDIQKRLCSNVMRDAKHQAKANFPEENRDVFFELVGFCGIWGFRDFNQPQWLRAMLEWQQDSGCFNSHAGEYCFDEIPEESRRRRKREELLLDDGCYSHTTGVSLVALAVNVRFEAEKLFHTNMQQRNHSSKFFPLIFVTLIFFPLIYICIKSKVLSKLKKTFFIAIEFIKRKTVLKYEYLYYPKLFKGANV